MYRPLKTWWAAGPSDQLKPWEHVPDPMPPTSVTIVSWHSSLQLLIGGLSLLCTVILFAYFCYEHRRTKALTRNSPVRRSLWTTDQVNACLIPLAIAVAFFASFFLLK